MDKDMQPVMSIDALGDTIWLLNDQYHREDGPAIEYADGRKDWVLHGRFHRKDGPAIEWPDGATTFYIHNTHYTFDEWLIANTEISEEEKVMMKLRYG
jgi:hypothetical protein